jgi:hypothetical protein
VSSALPGRLPDDPFPGDLALGAVRHRDPRCRRGGDGPVRLGSGPQRTGTRSSVGIRPATRQGRPPRRRAAVVLSGRPAYRRAPWGPSSRGPLRFPLIGQLVHALIAVTSTTPNLIAIWRRPITLTAGGGCLDHHACAAADTTTRGRVITGSIHGHAPAGVGRPSDRLDHLQHADRRQIDLERIVTRWVPLRSNPTRLDQRSHHLGQERRRCRQPLDQLTALDPPGRFAGSLGSDRSGRGPVVRNRGYHRLGRAGTEQWELDLSRAAYHTRPWGTADEDPAWPASSWSFS